MFGPHELVGTARLVSKTVERERERVAEESAMPWFVTYLPERPTLQLTPVRKAGQEGATENRVFMMGYNVASQLWEFATAEEAETYIREHPPDDGFQGHAVQAQDLMAAALAFARSLKAARIEEGWTC